MSAVAVSGTGAGFCSEQNVVMRRVVMVCRGTRLQCVWSLVAETAMKIAREK
jgi:hypothetical protein